MGPDWQSKDTCLAGVFDKGTLIVIMQILSLVREESGLAKENKIVMECYLLCRPKIRGYRKPLLSLCLQKGMCWVSEQRSVDQENTICKNSLMTESEIEELERKVTGSDSVIVIVIVLSSRYRKAKVTSIYIF